MNIYTRGGDRGETDLLGGIRAAKDALPLQVCGDFDELDAWLGLVRCEPLPDGATDLLERIQRRMVDLRTALVVGPPASPSAKSRAKSAAAASAIAPEDVEAIEQAIDRCSATLEPVRAFILPAGCPAAAALHVARAVCRRAERNMATLARSEPQIVTPAMSAYVNRLSDLLFVLARSANANAGVSDVPC